MRREGADVRYGRGGRRQNQLHWNDTEVGLRRCQTKSDRLRTASVWRDKTEFQVRIRPELCAIQPAQLVVRLSMN